MPVIGLALDRGCIVDFYLRQNYATITKFGFAQIAPKLRPNTRKLQKLPQVKESYTNNTLWDLFAYFSIILAQFGRNRTS